MSEDTDPPESFEGTSDTFASVWVKVEMCDEPEKIEVTPNVQTFQKIFKPKKKPPRTPTVLQCPQCPYTSIYKNCFKMHVLDHLNCKPFACNTCSYATKYPTSLQRHMFIKHQVIGEENKTLLHCDGCDYSTYFKWNLKSHRRRHATNKQYQCEHCTYSTAYRHNFVKHSRVHNKTNREYKCDRCPFVTKFTGHIQRHMSQIHNEVSDKASACEFCDFTTMVRWRLNVHKQRSKQENPIKCGRCNFQTHYMCQSKKHKKMHLNEHLKANSEQRSNVSEFVPDKVDEVYKDPSTNGVLKDPSTNGVFRDSSTNEVFKDPNTNGVFRDSSTNGVFRDSSTNVVYKDPSTNGVYKDPSTNGVYKDPITNGVMQRPNEATGLDTDGISKGILNPEPAIFGMNDKSQITNEYNDPSRMMKGFLKAGGVNLYDIMNVVNQSMGQIGDRNEYTDVRMTDNYLKSDNMHLYEMVNEVDHSQISTNPPITKTDVNYEQNTSTSSKTEVKKKPQNYVVDPKCETRKTIQVLESEDTERPFQCVKCAYTSKFKAAVVRHYQRLHTSEEKPYKCCNCDFSTKTKDQISLHNKRSQSEGTLICNICNFTTSFKCTYVMHQKVHYAHKCTICDYSCRNKYDIQKHFTTVHLGEGMKCRFCDYRSGRRESLLCHEAVHTGNKPFKCELCEYQSVRRSLLEVHFRRCHRDARFVDGKIQLCEPATVN